MIRRGIRARDRATPVDAAGAAVKNRSHQIQPESHIVGTRHPGVDAYIAKSAPFAQPILSHLRELVHQACPPVEETLKWGFPHFMHHGIVCSMAAFKAHAAFGFWHQAMRESIGAAGNAPGGAAMGEFGRITALADLPKDKALAQYIRKAAALNESGEKPARPRPPAPKGPRTVDVPEDFAAALGKNRKARAAFEAGSYSFRKEYVMWVGEAKRAETRAKRIATSVEWLADGKSRNWKYENC